ncbi:MAG: tyrosine-type recombinase/integrase [bacterium]
MTPKKIETKWEECGFIIRRVNKGKPFQVDEGTRNGTRRRVRYATLGEARQRCKELRVELTNNGTAGQNLSDRDRLEAAEARKELGKVAIMEAVRFYLRHHSTGTSEGMTVSALIEEYLKAPGRRGKKGILRRERTTQTAKNRLNTFKETFGKRAAAEITRQDVEGWLVTNGWGGLNARNYLSNVRALYAYAIRKELQTMNPAEKVELPENPEAKTPDIMTPAHVRALLAAAVKHDAALVPRLAISFFAGVRAAELDRLDWAAVNLAAGTITIEPAVAKMRRQRHITITENLRDWLLPYRKTEGRIWKLDPMTFHHRAAKVAKKAKVKVPQNGGRHAFASYHLAQSEDAGKTALQLGHARPDLLLTVYRNIRTSDGKPITKETAQAYFDIRPGVKAEIIPFPIEAVG